MGSFTPDLNSIAQGAGTQPQQQPQAQQPDQIEQLKQRLAQQATPPPQQRASGVKGMLQNFFQGFGNAAMHEAGLPTEYEKQQKALSDLNTVTNTQAMQQLHQNMASQYQPVPLVGLDGKPITGPDGKVISIPAQHAATFYAGQAAAASRVQAAGVTGQYRMAALLAGTAPITQDDIDKYNLPPEFLGKVIKPSEISGLQRSQNSAQTVVQGEAGPSLVNKQTTKVTPLGLGNPSMGRPMQVGNPNAPGETMTVTGGTAVRQGLPGTQSASVQVPRQAAKSELPTNVGNQKVAFNTAIQHADLLRQAAKALNNGDVRLLNDLSNRAATQFGDPNLTDFNAIANAYNHEVTSVISKGHITNEEVKQGGATLPSNANYATIDKVLGSYQGLMQSKMNQLNTQKQTAISQSQPRGNQNTNTPAPTGGFARWKANQPK